MFYLFIYCTYKRDSCWYIGYNNNNTIIVGITSELILLILTYNNYL